MAHQTKVRPIPSSRITTNKSRSKHNSAAKKHLYETQSQDTGHEYRYIHPGLTGLMKAYNWQPTFFGSSKEDLYSSITVLNTMGRMCRVTDDEKLQFMPFMLKGDAFKYYATREKECKTIYQACDLSIQWYVNADKRTRILTKWQTASL